MYQEHLEALKMKLHILHDDDDKNLLNQLELAHSAIEGWVGEFNLTNKRGLNLVFEYVRFSYNGQTEYFYPCFKSDLSSLSFELYQPPDEVIENE